MRGLVRGKKDNKEARKGHSRNNQGTIKRQYRDRIASSLLLEAVVKYDCAKLNIFVTTEQGWIGFVYTLYGCFVLFVLFFCCFSLHIFSRIKTSTKQSKRNE